MTWPQRTPPDAAPRGSRRRWWLVLAGAVAALAGAALLSPRVAGWLARRSAADHLETGALGTAEQSLAWSDAVQGPSARSELLKAACFRRLGERDAWQTALRSAEELGETEAAIGLERSLGELRFGIAQSISPADYEALVAGGAAPRDAVHAVVFGLLAKGQQPKAQRLIEIWQPEPADEAEAAYLRGVCLLSASNREAAQTEFEQALDQRPHHEPARASLARVFEEQYRLQEALTQHAPLLAAAPQRESVRVDLARALRKVGRLDDARRVLPPPDVEADASPRLAMELAEIEYESGNYPAARRWFEQADLSGQHIAESLRSAASNYALAGSASEAEQLFARIDNAQGLSRQLGELQRRLAIDPNDSIAAGELQRLSPTAVAGDPQPAVAPSSAQRGSDLYIAHCAACHGIAGRGDGRAARHLFPRPRDLARDKYRLISTPSKIPTLTDIEQILQRGMPGTSMPPFAELTPSERHSLAAEVLSLYHERFGDQGEKEPDSAEESVSVPALGTPDGPSIARGREAYLKSGCQQCHGDDGTGAEIVKLYDDEGRPTVARDLVRDPLKGSADGAALYLRIRLGMPGTPHPASPSLQEAELVDLVHFCQSIAREPQQQRTNHERALQAAQR